MWGLFLAMHWYFQYAKLGLKLINLLGATYMVNNGKIWFNYGKHSGLSLGIHALLMEILYLKLKILNAALKRHL